MTNLKNISTLLYRIILYVKEICYLFLSLIFQYINIFYIKRKIIELEKQVEINFDLLDYRLDKSISDTRRRGIVFFKKITGSKTPNNSAPSPLVDCFTSVSIKKDNISSIEETNRNPELGDESNQLIRLLDKGNPVNVYSFTINNLVPDNDYMLSFEPVVNEMLTTGMNGNNDPWFNGTAGTKPQSYNDDIGTNTKNNTNYVNSLTNAEGNLTFYKDKQSGKTDTNGNVILDEYTPAPPSRNPDSYDGKDRVRTVLPVSKKLDEFTAPPYPTNKITTIIKVGLSGSGNTGSGMHYCSTAISEYAETASVQGSSFWSDTKSNYAFLFVPQGQNKNSLKYATTYGGKAYSELPFFIKFRTSFEESINVKVEFFNVDEVSNAWKDTNITWKTHTCLKELLIKCETIYQERPIKLSPDDSSNVNNPEISYNDGGERYYEPWKQWTDGQLIDKNGNPSWFKKYRAWFNKKIKDHNTAVEKGTQKTTDITPWKEDSNYKKSHL